MNNRSSDIAAAQNWLIDDQYPHGEWGRCEVTDPTAEPRTLETSKIKPNFFISSQAMLALKATNYINSAPETAFFSWLEAIRDQDGYWTNASGTQTPMGGIKGWSAVKNIRHTAKALDMLLLAGRFTSGDAEILRQILDYQLENGSFPQVPDGPSDIWSTSYVINLLIRARHDNNISQSIPRGSNRTLWATKLTTYLDRARAWICSKLSNGLWHLPPQNSEWVTEAVLAEIGADLSLNRPDIAVEAACALIRSNAARRGQTYWALLLVYPALPKNTKVEVDQMLDAWKQLCLVDNTFDMACSLRAFFLKENRNLLRLLINSSQGHESLMCSWEQWTTPSEDKTNLVEIIVKPIDFVIITIRDDECAAVLKCFPTKVVREEKRRTYDICTFKSRSGMLYEIAVLKAYEQGHCSAQSATSDVIADLNPKCIFVVGIAGAVPESEFGLGDVIFANRVIDFSISAALNDGRNEFAGRGAPAHKMVQDLGARLPALAKSLGRWGGKSKIKTFRPKIEIIDYSFSNNTAWEEKIKSCISHHNSRQYPVVTSASVVSANKLVKDIQLIQEWLHIARDLKAVEMELPGVYEAARGINGDVPVIAIRGISDIVGLKRNPAWTKYACESAAAFTRALIFTDQVKIR